MKTMKKTMKTLLALMAGVMAFSACNKENSLTNDNLTNTPEVKGIHSFTAFTESDPATRATIDGLSVKWQENDEISVIADNDNYGCYRLTDGANSTTGTFEAVGAGVSGSTIYAVYPYNVGYHNVDFDEALYIAMNDYGVSEETASRVLNGDDLSRKQRTEWENSCAGDDPRIQAYLNDEPIESPGYPVEGNTIKGLYVSYNQSVRSGEMVSARGAVLMAAKADEANNLAFKNVCSYIKVTTTTPLHEIKVIANNGEYIAGKFDVDFSSETPATTAVNESGTDYIYFNAYGDLAPGTYYIAVVPGTLTGGLTIRYYTDSSNYTEKSTSSSFTFERNKVYNGGSQPE